VERKVSFWSSISKKVNNVVHQVEKKVENTAKKVEHEVAEATKHVKQTVHQVEKKAEQTVKKVVKDTVEISKDAKKLAKEAEKKVEHTVKKVEHEAVEATKKVKETVHHVEKKIEHTVQKVEHEAAEATKKVKETVHHVEKKVEHTAKQVEHAATQAIKNVKKTVNQIEKKVEQTANHLKRDTVEISENAMKLAHQLEKNVTKTVKNIDHEIVQDGKKVLQNVKKGVRETAQITRALIDGASDAATADVTLNLIQNKHNTNHQIAYKTGEMLGHIVSSLVGGAETEGSEALGVGSVALDATGEGAFVGVPLGGVALAGISDGSAIMKRGVSNTGQSIKELYNLVVHNEEKALTSIKSSKGIDKVDDITKGTGKVLLPGEGKVGTYEELIDSGTRGDNITPHHMPSKKYMESNAGVHKDDGVSMNMEHPHPGTGGRHRQTETYGLTGEKLQDYLNLEPRDVLARDIWDARRIYKNDGLYTPEIRSSLKEVIKRNKTSYPQYFNKK
jgi:hypothetical protein